MIKLCRITAVALALVAIAPAANAAEKIVDRQNKGDISVKPEEFRKILEKRMATMRADVEKKIGKMSLPEKKRTEIRKELDEASKEVRAAVDKAAADGVITREEAKQVKVATNHFRDLVKKQVPHNKKRAKK